MLKRANAFFIRHPASRSLKKMASSAPKESPRPHLLRDSKSAPRGFAGITAVDDSHLQNSDQVELNRLRSSLESTVLLFPIGRSELEPGQENNIASAANNIRALLIEARSPERQTQQSISSVIRISLASKARTLSSVNSAPMSSIQSSRPLRHQARKSSRLAASALPNRCTMSPPKKAAASTAASLSKSLFLPLPL